MLPPQYTDPLGGALPALEQNTLKLRAMQMLLVLFYAEELKRDVVSLIQGTDKLFMRLDLNGAKTERVPVGTKNPVKKALTALVVDKAITEEEMVEIEELIDYRNAIGHQLHNLMADLGTERIARKMVAFMPDHLPKYDYRAVERLQHFHKRLNGLYRTHAYLFTVRFNSSLFRSAEKTFLAEIKRLNWKIARLTETRRKDVEALNVELSLEGTGLTDDTHPRHPLNQYDNGRLTARGAEVCYRLFDHGKSVMAVAHLAGLSLVAARKRRRMWDALGGLSRPHLDLVMIPHRKFYFRRND